jgi:hypothetical protein
LADKPVGVALVYAQQLIVREAQVLTLLPRVLPDPHLGCLGSAITDLPGKGEHHWIL